MKTIFDEIQADENAIQYKAYNGNLCYRTFGNLDYFILLCSKYNLDIKFKSQYQATADGKGFSLEYCEHDIIFAIDRTNGEAWERGGWRERYAIQNGKRTIKTINGEKCYIYTYDNAEEYQDANGATYNTSRKSWIN